MEVVYIPPQLNKAKHIRERVLKWSDDNLRYFPWREDRTPYKVMVAEFLLKRTTATAVSRVYTKFLANYPNITDLSNARTIDLKTALVTLGYHKSRSRAIKESAIYVIEEYSGSLPCDLDELLTIPNIGYYTAGAILSLGYGKKAPMVDSNVERVITRVYHRSLPEKAVIKWVQKVVEEILPDIGHDRLNLALIDIGAMICTYKTRHCRDCPLSFVCDSAPEQT